MTRIFLTILIFFLHYCGNINGLELKKVLVISRHNLRTSLYRNIEILSPKQWPKWSVKNGHLTPKGELLESYMGKYFSAWLHKKGLLQDRCPNNSVYIYSNYLNRTRGTARSFSQAAFPNCNVTVHFKNVTFPFPKYDPVFPFLITNASDEFLQSGYRDMQENLNQINLNDAYVKLNSITDIRHSEICKDKGFCDLTEGIDAISFNFGEYPSISGRFRIANWLADAFLMSSYEGFPSEVGWGGFKNEDELNLLTRIVNESTRIRYHLAVIRFFLRPLLEYMKKVFNDETLFTLIVGHDSNLSPLIFSMGFNPYVLPEQFEKIPIGSKLVFQKWTDGVKDFLKVEFVYQSTKQIKNAEALSLSNPPKNITMHFKTLTADENGMYPWIDFEKLLDEVIR